jgi:hypothetical protein
MSLDPFTPDHLKQQSGACGGLAGAFGGGLQSGLGMAQRQAAMSQSAIDMMFRNSSAKGALRDGTGKVVSHPETFIEELQAETNEWLEGVLE